MMKHPNVSAYGAGIFTITDFLSEAECAKHIRLSEGHGFAKASIRTDEGDKLIEEARNNDRLVLDNAKLAAALFQRARPHLPSEVSGLSLAGLNPRFRYYRYAAGQHFDWHWDGTVEVDGAESCLTLMIYLNHGFEGGSTDFAWDSVAPRQGMALVFPHRLRHRGERIRNGVKYVLRTDVMYAAHPTAPSGA